MRTARSLTVLPYLVVSAGGVCATHPPATHTPCHAHTPAVHALPAMHAPHHAHPYHACLPAMHTPVNRMTDRQV